MEAVALVVVDRRDRRVDRNLVEVRPTKTRELCIDVRMDAPGEQRIVGEVDARNDVRGAERDLFGLSEEVVGIAIEHHAADRAHRNEFFRHDLGRIEHVETELLGLFLGEHLQAEFVLRVLPGFDRFPQVATVIVGIGAGNLDRFVPDQRMRAEHRRPVELDEDGAALRIDHAEGVHAEALHGAIAARDRAVAHLPQQHVRRFGHQRHEIPERVVRARRLRHLVMRLGFDGVHEVRELHRVLDEEHRDVVANEIPVALLGVELHREAAYVARGVLAAALAGHGGETHEHRRALACGLERRGHRDVGDRLVRFEETVRARTARMHDAFGNALVVEVRDLLAQDEVLEQRGTAQAGLQRVLVVRNRHALVGGERLTGRIDAHAIERIHRRVLADAGGRTGLVVDVDLGERAGADDGFDVDVVAFGRDRNRAALCVFGRLRRVHRHRGRDLLRLRHLFGRCITGAARRTLRTAAVRLACGGLARGFTRLARAGGRCLAAARLLRRHRVAPVRHGAATRRLGVPL
ncbi:hypothetical protein ACVWWW_000766 [Lysobacter sp. HA18]